MHKAFSTLSSKLLGLEVDWKIDIICDGNAIYK